MLAYCELGRRTNILVNRINEVTTQSLHFSFYHWPHRIVAKIKNVKTWEDLGGSWLIVCVQVLKLNRKYWFKYEQVQLVFRILLWPLSACKLFHMVRPMTVPLAPVSISSNVPVLHWIPLELTHCHITSPAALRWADP